MLKKIIYLIFGKLLFNVKYINKDIEKSIGKCVVCSNHLSFADPLFLYSQMKSLAIMAKSELFRNKFIGKILNHYGVFAIRRGEKDVKSILHSVNIFKDNKSERLLIFPEGTRVRNNRKVKAKIGAVYISLKANVPILPVRIIKKHPNRKLFTSILVIYGNPILLDRERIKDKIYLQDKTDEIMNVIYNLK